MRSAWYLVSSLCSTRRASRAWVSADCLMSFCRSAGTRSHCSCGTTAELRKSQSRLWAGDISAVSGKARVRVAADGALGAANVFMRHLAADVLGDLGGLRAEGAEGRYHGWTCPAARGAG